MSITDLLDWFAGGRQRYMTIDHCMHHDVLWITLTVLLDAAVAVGCLVIARHWRRNEATLPPSPPRKALHNMKNIFMFCGLCGYLFIPIKMFWPAWRLYDLFLLFLVYHIWRHALGARDLRVIYAELGQSAMLERDLKEARGGAEEARRKSFFLNAISHDLKTPLHGLMLQAELAELSLASGDPNALRESLAEIKGCARATADLLNRFLEIARLDRTDEPSQIRLVNLGELLREVAGQAHAAAEQKGLRLAASAPNEVSIPSDRVKLARILLNLVDNAIKFTHYGSVELGADVGSSGVAISVTDTGEGIAPNTRRGSSKISSRCTTVSATAGRASDWGWPSRAAWRSRSAARSRSRVRLAGGAGSPSSCPPPRHREGAATEARDDPAPLAPERPRLLLDEDVRATCGALGAIFRRRGWDVTTASTVAKALALLPTAPARVVLDLMLPHGNGVWLLSQIRAERLPIRVAVTTGTSDPDLLDAACDLQPEVMLQMPIDLRDLLRGLGIA